MLIDATCKNGAAKLAPSQIAALLPELRDWRVAGSELTKSYKFADFAGSIAFVNRLAAIAEQQNHHPDFRVAYDRVEVTLTTHDAGGLTQNDFIVAAKLG